MTSKLIITSFNQKEWQIFKFLFCLLLNIYSNNNKNNWFETMATQTKSKIKTNLDSNVKSEDILQAVIIGDSFNTRFAPITHFKPRVCYFYINYQ
jgi:hypothetical protein